MRKKLAIGAVAMAAAAVAGCSSGSGHETSAAGQASASSTTGPATGTAACNAINQTLNTVMGSAAKATPAPGSNTTKQMAQQASLATTLDRNAKAFTDDQSEHGITPTLKQAEQTIAGTVHSYALNYSKPDSGTYGMKIITALNQVKQQCGTASWQTAI